MIASLPPSERGPGDLGGLADEPDVGTRALGRRFELFGVQDHDAQKCALLRASQAQSFLSHCTLDGANMHGMAPDNHSKEREQQRAWVRGVAQAAGLTPTELAKKAGLTPSTLNRFLNDEKVTHLLSTRTIAAIRKVVGDSNHEPAPLPIDTEMPRILKSKVGVLGLDDLPVLGHGEGGKDGLFFDNGEVRQYVPRPATLLRVNQAYAIFMHGHSMEPRFREGELLYVNPHRPPSQGDDVVIEMTDGRGFVKRLVRRTTKTVYVQQFNPAKEIEFPAGDIKNIHLIVGTGRT